MNDNEITKRIPPEQQETAIELRNVSMGQYCFICGEYISPRMMYVHFVKADGKWKVTGFSHMPCYRASIAE